MNCRELFLIFKLAMGGRLGTRKEHLSLAAHVLISPSDNVWPSGWLDFLTSYGVRRSDFFKLLATNSEVFTRGSLYEAGRVLLFLTQVGVLEGMTTGNRFERLDWANV